MRYQRSTLKTVLVFGVVGLLIGQLAFYIVAFTVLDSFGSTFIKSYESNFFYAGTTLSGVVGCAVGFAYGAKRSGVKLSLRFRIWHLLAVTAALATFLAMQRGCYFQSVG